MLARVGFVFIVACASPPAAHTIAPASSSSGASEAHWPSAPTDRSSVITSLKSLHAVAEAWRVGHPEECPTLQRLKDERELAASTNLNDPWGNPYKVLCDEDTTRLVSSGPDRRDGTADDVAYP